MDKCFGSMPIFRDGDTVYIINNLPSISYVEDNMSRVNQMMEKSMLARDDYSCPFDFLNDFERWFEWYRRLYSEKQTTGKIITSMLSDVVEIKKHKIKKSFSFDIKYNYETLDSWFRMPSIARVLP